MKGAAAEQTMLQPEPVPAHSLPDVDVLPRPRVVVKSREKSRVLHWGALSAAGQQIAGQLGISWVAHLDAMAWCAWGLRVESRSSLLQRRRKLQAEERLSGEQFIDPPHQREIVVIAAWSYPFSWDRPGTSLGFLPRHPHDHDVSILIGGIGGLGR
jgi:hypothetical protein